MEFGALGPLRVMAAGQVVRISASKQRAVLGILMLRANRVVSISRLVDGVWGAHPPATAPHLVHTYVWQLRRLLGQQARDRPLVGATGSQGYLLQASDDELDITIFERRLNLARTVISQGDPVGGANLLRAALALWRGEPLEDVELHGEYGLDLQRLADLRVSAQEERIAADLACGRHDVVIAEIEQSLTVHPLRESLIGQLMLALHRAGRRDEALEVFQRARTQLADELGLDPAAELSRLHRRILADDPALAPPDPVSGARPDVPRQLPAAVRLFVGREAELCALTELADPGRAAGTVVISAIEGTAGIGKTALAVQFAHRVARHFPDGQLYVDLRGFDPVGPPVPPADAIRAFLQALAVRGDRIPSSLDGQISTYRTLLSSKRMLVVLDNARDVSQVRPLIPGSPSCLVIITSRNQLTGLAVTEAAQIITLDLLTDAEAHDLLIGRLGAERVAAEPNAADDLIALCARLPLALSIAAAHAAAQPKLALATLATDLRDVHSRLDLLDAGDVAANTRAVFSWSYQNLGAAAAQMFRLLGMHPGPDVSASAAASLAGAVQRSARQQLRELSAAHLLTEHAPGRYSFHDLLRVYAAEQAAATDDAAELREAIHRVLDHYMHTAYAAAVLLNPARDKFTLDAARPGAVPELITDHQQALDWFEAERPVLLAAISMAASEGFDLHAGKIPWALTTYLHRLGHWHEWAAIELTGLAAATRTGDQVGQAHAYLDLGYAHARLGAFDDARTHLHCALRLYGQLGDPFGQARVHNALAVTLEQQERPAEALDHARSALRLCRLAGHEAGQANALNAVGWYCALTGSYTEALESCQQALELHRELGDRDGEAAAWDSLGYANQHLGNQTEATASYRHALDLYQEIGARYYQTETLIRLGETHQAAGQIPAARAAWQQALAILDDLHHPETADIKARLSQLDHLLGEIGETSGGAL